MLALFHRIILLISKSDWYNRCLSIQEGISFFLVSCFVLIDAYPSKSSAGHRHSPFDGINDGIFTLEQLEPSRYPPPTNSFLDMLPKKRQSFGRKHHWDAFFGRRR